MHCILNSTDEFLSIWINRRILADLDQKLRPLKEKHFLRLKKIEIFSILRYCGGYSGNTKVNILGVLGLRLVD